MRGTNDLDVTSDDSLGRGIDDRQRRQRQREEFQRGRGRSGQERKQRVTGVERIGPCVDGRPGVVEIHLRMGEDVNVQRERGRAKPHASNHQQPDPRRTSHE